MLMTSIMNKRSKQDEHNDIGMHLYMCNILVRELPPPTPREAYLPQRLERTQEREA